jgi:peptidyl-tRNA hydrolase, PTH1 family
MFPLDMTDPTDPLLPRRDVLKVILGLGNPGKEYELTRHNVGFWVVDALARAWHADNWRKDGEAQVARASVGGVAVRLVKPQTYYNLVGITLRPYLRREGWRAEDDLLVIGDDATMVIGKARLRASGSAGGSNGLKSVEQQLRSQNYARLRLGTQPDDPRRVGGSLSDFVLSRMPADERDSVEAQYPRAVSACEEWVTRGVEPAVRALAGQSTAG